MIFTGVLVAIVVLPAIILTAIKSNATITFLSLCAGYVLLRFIGDEAILAGTALSSNRGPLVPSIVQIGVLVGPVILSAVVMRNSVHGPKLAANLIPGLALGLLLALLAVPLLPPGTYHNIAQTALWDNLERPRGLIVGAGVLLSLSTLWLGHKRSSKEHGKKKHH